MTPANELIRGDRKGKNNQPGSQHQPETHATYSFVRNNSVNKQLSMSPLSDPRGLHGTIIQAPIPACISHAGNCLSDHVTLPIVS